ncbi:MAG: hypothetical protein ABL951_11325 [Alphaproteobacteria bacterium]
MTDDPYADRKGLTFEQAEGVAPLPSQLQLKEVSTELRALLWRITYDKLMNGLVRHSIGFPFFDETWHQILYDKHVLYDHKMADEFENRAKNLIDDLKPIFVKGDYTSIFGFLQFVLRHRRCPYQFDKQINRALIDGRAAFRIVDGNTIIPIASDAEGATLERAFANLATTEFQGARAHLRMAGEQLTAGNCADSIRESIHAVESVARVIAPLGKFSEALSKLEASSGIHGGLKAGFNSIYGYTSDEKGLRHPLLDGPQANVDEADALFMIGACASFVSYMIHKARLAGLLKS